MSKLNCKSQFNFFISMKEYITKNSIMKEVLLWGEGVLHWTITALFLHIFMIHRTFGMTLPLLQIYNRNSRMKYVFQSIAEQLPYIKCLLKIHIYIYIHNVHLHNYFSVSESMKLNYHNFFQLFGLISIPKRNNLINVPLIISQ